MVIRFNVLTTTSYNKASTLHFLLLQFTILYEIQS